MRGNTHAHAVGYPGRGGRVRWGDLDDPDAIIGMLRLSDEHVATVKDEEELEATPLREGREVVVLDKKAKGPPNDAQATAIS